MAASDTVAYLITTNVVTIRSTKITSNLAKLGHFLWGAVAYVPFAGSIQQIGVGIYHGDWKEIALGTVSLGVDVFTGGEGGEAIRATELAAKDLIKTEAEDEVKEIAEKNLSEAYQMHHSDPVFMGGDVNQDLTAMTQSEHSQLHNDLNEHLEGYKNADGKSMQPKRGNSGAKIRENFTRSQRLNALSNFYKGPGAKYTEAAKAFFKQHPNL